MRRGDTGQRGESFDVSETRDGFRGMGARMVGPPDEGGGSAGVLADEIEDRVGALDTEERNLGGLGSCTLFFRDLDAPPVEVRVCRAALTVGLVGDASRESRGDGVNDVLAEVHLDCWVSTFVLDAADASLSTEFRLDKLASSPGAVALAAMVSLTQSRPWARKVVVQVQSRQTGSPGQALE